MGLLDRLRAKDKSSSPEEDFDALMAQMTRQGVVIITRDEGAYTVYWARRQEEPMAMHTTVDALKRSVEGCGATALEAILDCRERARHQVPGPGAGGMLPARTVVRTTTTTETRTEVPKGSPEAPPSEQPSADSKP